MKAIQAIKKMVALGMGLTMVGATIFGASAVNLSDWPAPFLVNGTPASNLKIVVGAQADGSDVLGAIDIIQALQAQAYTSVPGPVGPSQLVVQGDAVEIGSTADILEIGEPIGDVRETLTEVDLDMLKGGQIVTDRGSTEYNQYLRFPQPGELMNNQSSAVIFAQDERDRVGHYLFWADGDTIFQWELEFEEGLESEVEGNDLVDLEDEDITILGQPFVIVDTDVINKSNVFGVIANGGSPNVEVDFIGGAVSAVLGENDKETYVVDGKEYEVEVLVISETSHQGEGSVKFRINGEITDELEDGETDVLADGTQIGIRDILATGKDIQKSIVQFYLGAYKVSFHDTNTSDSLATQGGAEVNEEAIEDSYVEIRGQFIRSSRLATSLDGSQFEFQHIRYNLTADAVLGDMYVPPGTGVREQLDEPEGMLTPNWDIRYEGLMDVGVTLFRLDSNGDDEYGLQLTNQEGIFFDFPYVSAEKNSEGLVNGVIDIKYGDNNDNLWFTEWFYDAANLSAPMNITPFTTAAGLGSYAFYINKQDFFVVSNCDPAAGDDTCFSHVLRYDNIDTTNRQITFTDVGTGTRQVTYDDTTFIGEFVVGGITYRVGLENAGGLALSPYQLLIDLTGDGNIIYCDEAVFGLQGEVLVDFGEQVNPLNTSNVSMPANGTCDNNTGVSTEVNLSLIVLAREFDETSSDEILSIIIEARSGDTLGIKSVSSSSGTVFGPFDLEENNDLSQFLSGFGIFCEIFDPSGTDQAEDLTCEIPLSQRGARVFVTGGVVTTSTVGAGGAQQIVPIQLGAAVLDTEVGDISAVNAIVVGGPCANSVAATLLGNPQPCYESVAPDTAMVKLFEHTNGNVALLINGRTAMNTRVGSRAVATGAIRTVPGKEAEVTGTLDNVVVRAV